MTPTDRAGGGERPIDEDQFTGGAEQGRRDVTAVGQETVPDRLHPDVAVDHRRVDADAWRNIYVVGDVHGCRVEFERLLDRLDHDGDELVVVVGDLVRKGPDSRGVVEIVADRRNVVSVRGNNERKVLTGDANLPELGEGLDTLASLPVAISWRDALVVHGGVDPRRELATQRTETLLTTRAVPPGTGYDGPFWFERYRGPPRVFFGHTVLEEPTVGRWAVGLDTGCVYGGALTAYDVRRDDVVSVQSRETYRERTADKWVTGSGIRTPGELR